MKNASVFINLLGVCFLFSVNAFPFEVEFEKHEISTFASGPQKVVTTDIDGDGDIDILSSATGIKLWENIGAGDFSPHDILGDIGVVISVKAEDIDGDGDLDIAAACYDAQSIIWLENTGDLNFVEHVVEENFDGAHDVYVNDINGDGSADLAAARGSTDGGGEIAWWENDGQLSFQKHTVFTGEFSHCVVAEDIDNDGDVDLVGTQFESGFRLWLNDGSQGFTGTLFPLNGAHHVIVEDVDKNGLPDIVSVGYMARKVAWWKNTGNAQFEEILMTSSLPGAVFVDAADIDGDGDIDILATGETANAIRWWDNADNSTFDQRTVATGLPRASGVSAADVDGDGDMDVVGTAWKASMEVSWWENLNGNQGGQQRDIVIDLGRGPVTVHVPASYDPSEPSPLVMVLHGYGMTGQNQESLMKLLPWVDQLGFIYVHPDGTRDQDQAQFWNATDACCDFYGSGVDDSGYLRSLIDQIILELAVDTDRIYLIGFSNGAFMAYRMACDHSDIVAAVASLSGATFDNPEDCSVEEPVRTLQIHGTEDEGIDYLGGETDQGPYPGAVETTEQWASFNHCSLDSDHSSPTLDLDSRVPGFETMVAKYANDCEPGGGSELWTIVGGTHNPAFSADFTPLVLNFFLSDGGSDIMLTHRHFIPAAAFAAGSEGAFFRTDIDVKNSGADSERYRFSWLPRGATNSVPTVSGTYVLAPGAGTRYSNAVHEIFGLEQDALGAIAIETSSRHLLFSSRTYNTDQEGNSGTFGQAIPIIPERQAIQGTETRHILFADEGPDYRTNIGCLNTDRIPAMLNLELFDQQGSSLESVVIVLQPWSNDQLNRVFRDYRPVQGSVEVSALSPNTRYYCYGSMIDNNTNDPTTILPQ